VVAIGAHLSSAVGSSLGRPAVILFGTTLGRGLVLSAGLVVVVAPTVAVAVVVAITVTVPISVPISVSIAVAIAVAIVARGFWQRPALFSWLSGDLRRGTPLLVAVLKSRW
jgi:CBS domain containing-hemolysin-like protein